MGEEGGGQFSGEGGAKVEEGGAGLSLEEGGVAVETVGSAWEEDLFRSFSQSNSICFSHLAFFSAIFFTFFSSCSLFFSSCFLLFSFLSAQKRGKVFPPAGGGGGASSRTE